MANRRMFSLRITGSAHFLKMPISSQALYFHLGLRADDDGVVEAFPVIRSVGCTEDDLRVLVAKGYVVVLNEDLVAYITDWNENNQIRPDRKIDSIYKDLLVSVVPDAEIIEKTPRASQKTSGPAMARQWPDNGPTMARIGKDRLGQDRLVQDKPPKSPKGETVADLISDFSADEEVQQALRDFVEMRKSIKKPLTPRAMKGVLTKLRNLATRPDQQVRILEQSIEHDWQTVYALKEEKAETKTQQGVDMIAQWLAGREENGGS